MAGNCSENRKIVHGLWRPVEGGALYWLPIIRATQIRLILVRIFRFFVVSALELADVRQDAVELIQRAVFQDQPALALGAMFNQHFCPKFFGQLVL